MLLTSYRMAVTMLGTAKRFGVKLQMLAWSSSTAILRASVMNLSLSPPMAPLIAAKLSKRMSVMALENKIGGFSSFPCSCQ